MHIEPANRLVSATRDVLHRRRNPSIESFTSLSRDEELRFRSYSTSSTSSPPRSHLSSSTRSSANTDHSDEVERIFDDYYPAHTSSATASPFSSCSSLGYYASSTPDLHKWKRQARSPAVHARSGRLLERGTALSQALEDFAENQNDHDKRVAMGAAERSSNGIGDLVRRKSVDSIKSMKRRYRWSRSAKKPEEHDGGAQESSSPSCVRVDTTAVIQTIRQMSLLSNEVMLVRIPPSRSSSDFSSSIRSDRSSRHRPLHISPPNELTGDARTKFRIFDCAAREISTDFHNYVHFVALHECVTQVVEMPEGWGRVRSLGKKVRIRVTGEQGEGKAYTLEIWREKYTAEGKVIE